VTLSCEHTLLLHERFFDFVFHFVCNGNIEQCVCIKFCVKLSKSSTETLEMLHETFGEHLLSQAAVFILHSRFKAGRVSVEDEESSERPSTSITTENGEEIG
jgi:hypothetical protein